jgi:hypothetical protein
MKRTGGSLQLGLLLGALALSLAACHGGAGDAGRSVALDSPPRATTDMVEQWMAEGRTLVVLDSRSDVAWERGTTKAEGAIRVPPNDVDSVVDEIPRDGTVIVYCT